MNGEKTLAQSVSEQITRLCEESNFSRDVVNRLIFHYGYARTATLVAKLRQHPKTIPVRVNTLFTTIDKLFESLQAKNIPAQKLPAVPDCLLIEVEGPKNLERKEKSVQIKFSKKVNEVLTGLNLTYKDFFPTEDLKIGDEISVVTKKGEVIANGILMMQLEDILRRKKGVAIKIIESKYAIPNLKTLKEFLRGQFIRQSLGSILVGAQISLKTKDRFLILNAGRGELLSYIWQRNQNVKDVKYIAFERTDANWLKFDENIKRLRMYKLPVERFKMSFAGFARKFNRDETFDVIVIDGPSTNIGLRPKLFENLKENAILKTISIQRKYLTEAARLLKKGGTLFYLTNSLDPAENENNVQFAVEELNLKVAKQNIFIGSSPKGDYMDADKLQYLYPDKQDFNGQFIAKFTK
ncbi:MAG: PUA domain-containing protein [Candidatus Heimdallarchaeota archaeon]